MPSWGWPIGIRVPKRMVIGRVSFTVRCKVIQIKVAFQRTRRMILWRNAIGITLYWCCSCDNNPKSELVGGRT